MLIPLQLLPDGLRRVCMALPFASMAYAPARLASGVHGALAVVDPDRVDARASGRGEGCLWRRRTSSPGRRRMISVLATMRAAMIEAVANQAAFWSQVGAMVVNDLAWITFWLLLFHRVDSLRGWDQSGVLMLLAVLTVGGGFVLGLLSKRPSLRTAHLRGRARLGPCPARAPAPSPIGTPCRPDEHRGCRLRPRPLRSSGKTIACQVRDVRGGLCARRGRARGVPCLHGISCLLRWQRSGRLRVQRHVDARRVPRRRLRRDRQSVGVCSGTG